jgi:hypothetical protein
MICAVVKSTEDKKCHHNPFLSQHNCSKTAIKTKACMQIHPMSSNPDTNPLGCAQGWLSSELLRFPGREGEV